MVYAYNIKRKPFSADPPIYSPLSASLDTRFMNASSRRLFSRDSMIRSTSANTQTTHIKKEQVVIPCCSVNLPHQYRSQDGKIGKTTVTFTKYGPSVSGYSLVPSSGPH